MARMVELIRDGTAPRSMLRRAARGELALPAQEAIEVLMALAGDRELGAEAEQTLAGWDEPSLIEVASNAATPPELLRYLLRNQAERPAVVAALCGNPALTLEDLEPAASGGGVETLQGLLRSQRVRNSLCLLELMAQNPAAEPLRPILTEWMAEARSGEEEQAVVNILVRHADELAREDSQPFQLVDGFEGEEDPLQQLLTRAKQGEAMVAPEEKEQISTLQRIGRLRVGERIKLAIRGSREERMILIRDRSKLVSLAVLTSPKVNDAEMESYAAMKNIQETVLRAIAANRKNLKNYGVVRTLVNNPKTPLDVAMPLMAHMLLKDLRALAINKNVNETVRKMAIRTVQARSERKRD